MASGTVMVLVKSVCVVNNGATPDKVQNRPVSANVAITASLCNPNGEAEQTQVTSSVLPIPILGNVAVTFDPSNPWFKGTGPAPPLLFKTRIEGECPLLVEVDFAPHKDLFLTVLKEVVSNFGGIVTALVPGGAVVQAIVTGAFGLLGDELNKKSGGHVESIGQGPQLGAGQIMINVAKLTPTAQEIHVPLMAPNDVWRQWFQPNSPGQQPPVAVRSGNVITKGQNNGEVVLEAWVC